MSWYEVLGLPDFASAEEVSRRYKVLAKQFHPQGGTTPDVQRMTEINGAHAVLGHNTRKQDYDAELKRMRAGDGAPPDPAADEAAARARAQRAARRPSAAQAGSVGDAFRGGRNGRGTRTASGGARRTAPAGTGMQSPSATRRQAAVDAALAAFPLLPKPSPPTIGFGHQPFATRLVIVPFLFVGLYLTGMMASLCLLLVVATLTPLTMDGFERSAGDGVVAVVVVTAAILAVMLPLGGLDFAIGRHYQRRLRRYEQRVAERARIVAHGGVPPFQPSP